MTADLDSIEDSPARLLQQVLNEHAYLLSQNEVMDNLLSLMLSAQPQSEHSLTPFAFSLVLEVVIVLLGPQGIVPLDPVDLDPLLVWQAAKMVLQGKLVAGSLFESLSNAVFNPIRLDM